MSASLQIQICFDTFAFYMFSHRFDAQRCSKMIPCAHAGKVARYEREFRERRGESADRQYLITDAGYLNSPISDPLC